MATQAEDTDLYADQYYGYLTVTVPLPILRRLQPYSSRRQRSEFVRQAIVAALDKTEAKATEDREHAAV
jgi:hypothetical protein